MDFSSPPYNIIFVISLIIFISIIGALEKEVGILFIYLMRKLVVHSKRAHIIWTHQVRHQLPTPDHNDPFITCMDKHCDIYYLNTQALGLPEEEVSALVDELK